MHQNWEWDIYFKNYRNEGKTFMQRYNEKQQKKERFTGEIRYNIEMAWMYWIGPEKILPYTVYESLFVDLFI